MSRLTELTRPKVLREGAVPVPSTWPPSARSRLLAAMAERAAASGLLAVTVDDVIVAARASRRTFYEHFANRDECLLASYDAVRADVLVVVDEAATGFQPALTALLRYFAAWPSHARVLCVDILAAGPPGLERHEATMAQLATRIARDPALGRRRAPGELRADDMAHAVLGVVHRIVQRRLVDGRHASLPRLAPAICTLLATEPRREG